MKRKYLSNSILFVTTEGPKCREWKWKYGLVKHKPVCGLERAVNPLLILGISLMGLMLIGAIQLNPSSRSVIWFNCLFSRSFSLKWPKKLWKSEHQRWLVQPEHTETVFSRLRPESPTHWFLRSGDQVRKLIIALIKGPLRYVELGLILTIQTRW